MFDLIVLLPLLIVAAVLIFLALQPGDLRVERSLPMRVAPSRVFGSVRDLRGWPSWSPWLMHEPDAQVEFSDTPDQEGSWLSWNGKHIGRGRLTQTYIAAPFRIEHQLRFTRPFRSTSEAWWAFAELPPEEGPGTRVTWGMRGRMPFLLRFLTPLMTSAIGKDYELGLAQLRGQLDPDAEHPSIRFIGVTELAGQQALTIPYSGGIDGMVEAMEQGFPRLAAQLSHQGLEPPGPPFTAYHRVNAKATRFSCDLAMPAPDGADSGGLTMKHFAGGRYFLTEVHGSYDFLGAAWYSVMGHLRMYRLKQDPKRPSLEIYSVDPSKTEHSNELLTRIYVPIR
jgi:DNA gyrase inhibitor GyrI